MIFWQSKKINDNKRFGKKGMGFGEPYLDQSMRKFFTVTYRGGAVVLFEKAAQVVAVAEAVGGGDFVQRQIGFFQLLFGAREAEQIAIFNG